jgi:hypothetical protein
MRRELCVVSGAVLMRAERIARLNDLARRAMGIACVVVATERIRALFEADQSRLRARCADCLLNLALPT